MAFMAKNAGITTGVDHLIGDRRGVGIVIEVPQDVRLDSVIDIDAEVGKPTLLHFVRAGLPEEAVRLLAKELSAAVSSWDEEDQGA